MAAATLAAVAACDGPSGPPPVGSLDVLPIPSEAEVGSAVAIQVTALDDLGAPLQGAVLRFVPAQGSGIVSPVEGTSGADGVVTASWTLSTGAGAQTVAIEANGATESLSVTATPGQASRLSAAAGADQNGPVGEPLAEAVSILVTDEFDNPTPGAIVGFEVLTGDGSLDTADGAADATGIARVQWTLGGPLGSQTIRARLADPLFDLVVSATGLPGVADSLIVVDGDGQTGTVGTMLPEPLVVQAFDRFGNPTNTSPISFADASGGGAASDPSVQPDIDGLAAITWTLGTAAGTAEIVASAPGGAAVAFAATALAGPPAGLEAFSGNGQQGPATRALAADIVARVHDQFGNSVSGTTVAFAVTDGSGAVAPPQVNSDANGQASTRWTLGPALGSNRLSVTTPDHSGVAAIEFTAEATSLPPAQVQIASGDGQTTEVGTAVTSAPVVRVLDSAGNPVPGVAVVFSVASGNGSVTGASPITDGSGTAAVGSWTLGTTPGTNTLRATVDALTPAVFTATGLVGPPANLDKSAGDAQFANVGNPVPINPTVLVTDQFANPIQGVNVTFALGAGGGSISGANQTTGSNGQATIGSWTLGPNPGANSVTASVSGLGAVTFDATGTTSPPGFNVQIQYVGSSTGSQQSIINSAASRWNSVITGDLPDFNANLSAGACGVNHPAYNGTVDDVVVFVEIVPIDGAGGVLGSAGPCWVRGGSMLPVFGSVRLDAADVANLESSGRLFDVAAHEIGHVLGIGTLWNTHSFLQGGGSADPYFNGPRAIAEYQGIGGTHPNPVPVENTGGSGTRDSHWRESLMTTELMTGWLSGGSNPLSRVTIGSLDDMGYTVNYGAADGFVTTAPSPFAPPAIQLIELPMPAPIIVHPN